MFCTSCGHNIKEGTAFCVSCGSALGGRNQVAPGAESVAPLTAPAAPVDAPATRLSSLPQPPRRRAWIVVPVVVLFVIAVAAGGTFAAYKAGPIGSGTTETVVIAAEETSLEESADGSESSAESDGEAPASTLTREESFEALQDHYSNLWAFHAGIGLQEKDGYGGTGFVFEAGGFNQTIGAADLAVRDALVTRCEEWVDKITVAQDELVALKVDPAYDSQKAALVDLYAFMFNRADAMYQAAIIAVDRPARDNGWGEALQPRSKENRIKFENEYPAAKPVAQ